MSLVQVSSSQKNSFNENAGRTVFNTNRGFSFKNPFQTPLEIPPYAEVALHSANFSFEQDEIIVNEIGGDDDNQATGFRVIYCSNDPADNQLRPYAQVTRPLSNALDSLGLDWETGFTTKCPLWYFAPNGRYTSQTDYFQDLVKILNISGNPAMYKAHTVFESNETEGVSVNVRQIPNVTFDGFFSDGTNPIRPNATQFLQLNQYSGFVNQNNQLNSSGNLQRVLSLNDIQSGSGANAFYGSVELTTGVRNKLVPGVAQTNCTGIMGGYSSVAKTGGYVIPKPDTGDFATAVQKPFFNCAMFGISRAGQDNLVGFDKFFNIVSQTAFDPDVYDKIYDDATAAEIATGGFDWTIFMRRVVDPQGSIQLFFDEIFEYAYIITPDLADVAQNDKSNNDPKFTKKDFVFSGANATGFVYTILKLQYDSEYGYFYFPIATGIEVITIGQPRSYGMLYSQELNPSTYALPAIGKAEYRLGVGYDDESEYVGTTLMIEFEGNNVGFHISINNGTYVPVSVKVTQSASFDKQPLICELSQIVFPLQMKWSIRYQGAKWTLNKATWVSGKNAVATNNLEPLVYYGSDREAFDLYVENQRMLPNWIYNQQFWRADYGVGYEYSRTPLLILDTLDTRFTVDFQSWFKNETEVQNTAKTGYVEQQCLLIQLGKNHRFNTGWSEELVPNIFKQLSLTVPTPTFGSNTMFSAPVSLSFFNLVATATFSTSNQLPFASGLYVRLLNLPNKSSFGSINQSADRLLSVISRWDNYFQRASDTIDSVYSYESYEKLYIALNNPTPILLSSVDIDVVNRFGQLQDNIKSSMMVLHIRKGEEGGLFNYNRPSGILQNSVQALTI